MKKLILVLLFVPIISFGQKSYTIPEYSSPKKKLEILRMEFVDFATANVEGLLKELKTGRIRLKNYEYQMSVMMDAATKTKSILYKINLQDNNLDKLPSVITMVYENREFKFRVNNKYMNASELYRFL